MLVFSTRLPLRNSFTDADYFAAIAKWIVKSPHYHIEQLDFDPESEQDYELKKGPVTLTIRQVAHDDTHICACRLRTEDAAAVYSNDCIFVEEPSGKSLLIQLNRTQTNFDVKLHHPKKPYLLRQFVDGEYCKDDVGIPVTDCPLYAEDYLDICVNVMNGSHQNTMPVVYVSLDYWDEHAVDCKYLSQQLGGVAHVFVERSRSTALALKERTNGNNAHSGFVGIYLPGTKLCRKYSNRSCIDPKFLARDIIDAVWTALINRLDSSVHSWNQIIALQSRQKMLELQDISDNARKELNTYMRSFDSELEDLKEQNKNLNRQLNAAEAERDAYKSKLEDYDADACFYKTGEERELYASERNDLLYSILSQVRNKYPDKSRPRVLIDSMLKANPRIGDCKKMLDDISKVLASGGKLNHAGKSMLKVHGFEITEDAKHYHLQFHDPRYMFTMAKTPSEFRGGKNLCSEISKALNIEKKI